MDNINAIKVHGDDIALRITQEKHHRGDDSGKLNVDTTQSFVDLFNKALSNINSEQTQAHNLTQKLIADPQSVNVHNVLIATEKARMSLTLMKTIADLSVRTYRELTNIR